MGSTSPSAPKALTDPATQAVPRIAGWLLTALLAFWGIGAIGGGIALASARDGSNIGFELDLLDGTPFPDFRLPGLLLMGLGLGAVAAAVVLGRAVRRQAMPTWVERLLVLTALGTSAWILGEIAFLWGTVAAMPAADRNFFSVFWVAYVALALAIGGLTWWVTRRRTR